jgi:hypothetical protein
MGYAVAGSAMENKVLSIRPFVKPAPMRIAIIAIQVALILRENRPWA